MAASLAAIRAEGLKPMARNDVHLSADVDTAERVGARRGKPVVLTCGPQPCTGKLARIRQALGST